MQLLKFQPILKQTIWGGEKILPYKRLPAKLHGVGESWELSGIPGSESVVAEGPWCGYSLSHLIAQEGARIVGEAVFRKFGSEFPLLIKFIDAHEDLSIQVHPNDALARIRHHARGKTEMWYVIDADAGAYLYSGFAHTVTPDEYAASVANHSITQLLKRYEIHQGDLFFLPAGRIHSIGAGSFVVEIQQSSDITYRIYDFTRRDAQGHLRELHTELAKEAIDYTVQEDHLPPLPQCRNIETELLTCPYFTASLYDLDQPIDCNYTSLDSFVALICVGGSGTLRADNESEMPIRTGETLLVPAAVRHLRITPQPELKLLASYIR